MIRICPDCGKSFYFPKKFMDMLAETFIINLKLKIVCGLCGYKLTVKYIDSKRSASK
jgi:hypothetical protein